MSPNFKPTASRPTPNPPSDFERQVDEATGGVTIVRFLDETATACVVPAEIDGRPVRHVGDWAFDGCDSLTSVVIPSGVLTVGVRAFYNGKALTSVALPSPAPTLGSFAFERKIVFRDARS